MSQHEKKILNQTRLISMTSYDVYEMTIDVMGHSNMGIKRTLSISTLDARHLKWHLRLILKSNKKDETQKTLYFFFLVMGKLIGGFKLLTDFNISWAKLVMISQKQKLLVYMFRLNIKLFLPAIAALYVRLMQCSGVDELFRCLCNV